MKRIDDKKAKKPPDDNLEAFLFPAKSG